MTGVLLSVPPIDYQVHNSLFLIAHFHGMVIGGVLFGFFAAFTYWFPKFTGLILDETLNCYAFWCWFLGFLLAFMPLYMLGFMGATRRLNHYEASTGWHPLFILVGIGALVIMLGASIQLYGLYITLKNREKYRDKTGGDPWNGRTLEWATVSPPPVYNFAILPVIDQIDPAWAMKRGTAPKQPQKYEEILMPKNTAIPFYIGILSLVFGFAMTWQIYWLAILSFVSIVICLIVRLSEPDEHDVFDIEKIKAIEAAGTDGGFLYE
jgi:cytochrome o ubiquinol oxidase subunit 1